MLKQVQHDAKYGVSITGSGSREENRLTNSRSCCNLGSYPNIDFWKPLTLSSRTCFGICTFEDVAGGSGLGVGKSKGSVARFKFQVVSKKT